MIEAKPENLIGDRAYDSDPLDEQLRRDGIEMIAPHRSNRSKAASLAMNDEKVVRFNSSVELIEEAKKERQRLLAQIEQSQLTIEHSRQIIARIDEVLANTDEK
jgi:hypothetical protein